MSSESALLSYRIPGQEKCIEFGAFQLVEEGEVPSGFVVSDFKGERIYRFLAGSQEERNDHTVPRETTREQYQNSAEAFVSHLNENGGKAVLSRVKKVQLENPLEMDVYFDSLCTAYPEAFVYVFNCPLIGCWVGATPETLIASKNGKANTMALAGTRRSGVDLPWTEKEFEEHELVADFIQSNLEAAQVENIQRSERKEKISGPVRHLLTEFEMDIVSGEEWELATRLHPTPAVSGWPVKDALDLIAQNEEHQRRFYAGIIGWIGEETNLYVNLRCAEYAGNSLYLYVGGGFTKDSDIEAEWNETENKAATLINVLKNG